MSSHDARPAMDVAKPGGIMSRRWTKVLLIASLALNVLVFGAIAGLFLRGGPGGWSQGGPSNIFGFVAQLPKERREALQAAASELRGPIRTLRQTVRAANKERIEALLAEPFDRQRYVDAQARQIEADTKMRLLMRDAVAKAAADMTQDERRAFVRWRGQRRMIGASDPTLDDPPAKKP